MNRSALVLGFAVALCSAAPLHAQTAWDQPVNVTAAAGTLTKSGGCDGCPDAGAHSTGQITGDGYAEFVAVAGHRVVAGLATDLSASTQNPIDYAVSLWPYGAFEIRERGVYKSDGTYAAGDRFRVSVENGAVVYRRNGVPLYVSAAAPSFPMALDVTLLDLGATFTNAAIASRTLPTWTGTANATLWNGDVKKTSGCADCPDAGAHSATVISGNGVVEFVPAAGQRLTSGLNSDLSDSTDGSMMDYSFRVSPNGTFDMRERGLSRGEGTFRAGDRLGIAIDGRSVIYSRNGVAVYTSTVLPTAPMVFDATLDTNGAALYETSLTSFRSTATWESPVKVIATDGTLTKSGGCDGCLDSGAHSIFRLTGDGYVEFVSNGGTFAAGLSTDLSASTSSATTNYAFVVYPTSWEVRELGVYRKDGTFAAGSRFRVAVEAGKVIYRVNGVKVYASAAAPSAPMTLDVTLSSLGASLKQAATSTGASEYPAVATTPPPTNNPIGIPETIWPAGLVTRGPYTAIIERAPHAKPALPALGPAGTSFVDPVFQSTIGRITDALTRPGAPNRSFRTPSSPHQNAWSAGGSYFYVNSGDGTIIPFAFDATTGTARRLQPTSTGNGGLTLQFYIEPQFSMVNDSVIYGSASGIPGATLRTIDQYDFSTGVYSRLLDLDALVPGLAGTYVGSVYSSDGPVERVMAFFGGTMQDLHHYVVIFDKSNPANRLLLDTKGNTLNGQPTSLALSISLHHAMMDRSGRYVMLYSTAADLNGPRKAAMSYLWDTQTGTFTEYNAAALPWGHDAFGYGMSVNQDCCTASSWDAAQWQFRYLSAPFVTHDVIKTVVTPKEIYLADHTTWNNARPNQLMPFISGLMRSPASTTEWRAWDDEIIAVQTDTAAGAEATVWRFAHHRSDMHNDTDPTFGSFWYSPRPNVSPDGRWVLFTSNWEKTLGTDPINDPTTKARQDVFLVALKK